MNALDRPNLNSIPFNSNDFIFNVDTNNQNGCETEWKKETQAYLLQTIKRSPINE